MPNPLSLFNRAYRQLTERPLGYNWFWFSRRIGQKYIDPLYLRLIWTDLQTRKGMQQRLCQPWRSEMDWTAMTEALQKRANGVSFWGAIDLKEFEIRYASLFPEPKEKALLEAKDLLNGKFHYAGQLIETASPPDWYAEREIKGMHKWHRIPGAFHWLKTLGKAYWLTGETAYERQARLWLADWIDKTAPFDHDLWESTNFVGMRGINLLNGLLFFADAWKSHPDLLAKIWAQLYLHTLLLRRRMEFWSYNHLLWNARDLSILGITLEPFYVSASAWKRDGLNSVEKEMKKQFHEDGINIELSVHYQVFVTKLIGELLLLLHESRNPLPPDATQRFQSAANAIQQLQRPDGRLPLFGDGYRSYDPNIEGTIDDLIPYILRLKQSLPRGSLPLASHLRGSISVLKKEAQGLSLYALMMTGHSLSGKVHAHVDSLSVELADEKGPIVIDPGAYGEEDNAWRSYIRSAQAHNTICIDGEEMAKVSGVYGMTPGLKAAVTASGSEKQIQWVQACHKNYLRRPSQAHHCRLLALMETDLFLIVDHLTAQKPFRWERFFQFAGAELQPLQEGQWLWKSQGRGWTIQTISSIPMQERVMKGQKTPLQGWSGEQRGDPKPIPTLVQGSIGPAECLEAMVMTTIAREGLQVELALTPLQMKIESLRDGLSVKHHDDVWHIKWGV